MTTRPQILVAVDLTDRSRPVLEEGIRTARAFDGDLLLLHVVHQLDDLYGFYVGGGSVKSLQRDLEVSAREKLGELGRGVSEEAGVSCREVLLRGIPWAEIVSCAAHDRVIRIVLGAHVQGKPEHRMLGSTAERVLRHAPCPVLAVPREAAPAITTPE